MYEQRLVELGLTLPAAAVPSFNYVPVAIHNGVAWVAGQLPKVGEALLIHRWLPCGFCEHSGDEAD